MNEATKQGIIALVVIAILAIAALALCQKCTAAETNSLSGDKLGALRTDIESSSDRLSAAIEQLQYKIFLSMMRLDRNIEKLYIKIGSREVKQLQLPETPTFFDVFGGRV